MKTRKGSKSRSDSVILTSLPEEKDSSENSENDEEDELFNDLYELCEGAYKKGLDSVDIYNVLHSEEMFELVEAYLKGCRKEKDKDENKSWKNISLVLQVIKKLPSVLFYTATCLILLLILNMGVFYYLEMNPLILFPSLAEKSCLLPAHPIILEMFRPIQNCSMCQKYKDTNSIIVEYSSVPSESEFRSVAYLSRPVIVRGAAFGTGMPTTFNFAKLRKIFESVPGGVDSAYDDCQFLPFRSPFSSLREAFAKINDTAKWEMPWYIGWSNCHPDVAEKLREIFPRPNFLPSDSESSAIDWIFVGSPGMGASMHIDFVRRPSWQAQLSGTKQWTLKPVPECEDECSEANLEPIIIQPGDMIFLETNVWYHETMILGDNLSISIGSEYD